MPMAATTPISFSLPSQLQGETDAAGLCTIQLLRMIQTVHNTMLATLAQVNDVTLEEVATTIPHISLSTPPAFVRTRVIEYSRTTLDTLLFAYTHIPLVTDHEYPDLQFDFFHIEQALNHLLLRGKTPIAVQVGLVGEKIFER